MPHPILDRYSLEVTGKDTAQLAEATPLIAANTPVNIAFLGNESHAQRIAAAVLIKHLGLLPVPIVSARRLRSEEDRDALLGQLQEQGCTQSLMLVGGDPTSPAGPYSDAVELLDSGLLERFGVRRVVIAGYPEGHPAIAMAKLWKALEEKVPRIQEQGCACEITTQLCFAPAAILDWLREVRRRGIQLPIRVGLPGPADAAQLLRFARQFGVLTSGSFIRRHGLALGQLIGETGPGLLLEALHQGLAAEDLGEVRLHLYPFGGTARTLRWLTAQRRSLTE